MGSTTLTGASLLAILALGSTTRAADREFRETTLFECQTAKWTSLSLKAVFESTAAGAKPIYVLELKHESRHRESGLGIYTESVSPVFFTNAAKSATLKLDSSGLELRAEFEIPLTGQLSAVELVGERLEEAESRGRPAFRLFLRPGLVTGASASSRAAYDFFKDRWDRLIREALYDETHPVICEPVP